MIDEARFPPGSPHEAGGPPTKFTTERVKVIEDALRMGFGIPTAADLAEVHPRTVYYWREKDALFDQKCRTARAEGKRFAVAKLLEAVRNGEAWAVSLFLKTRCYDEFGDRSKVEVDAATETMAAFFERRQKEQIEARGGLEVTP